jgi:hypothetical protein
MKNISAALTAFLLANTVFGRADLIDILLPNGQSLHVVFGTNQDISYPDGGYTVSGYVAGGPTLYSASRFGTWEREEYKNSASFRIASESMFLNGLIPKSMYYPGTTTPLMQAINVGMLTGAKVAIRTIYWPIGGPYQAGLSMGFMVMTVGQIGDVKPAGRSKIKCEVFDLLYLLNRPCPPHQIQTACRHTLFDPSCTLNVANFQSTNVTIGSGSTNLYLNLSIPNWAATTAYVQGNVIVADNVIFMCTHAGTSGGSTPSFSLNTARGNVTQDGSVQWTSQNGAYPLGYVLFTGGQNSGLTKTVKAQVLASGIQQLQLWYQMPFPVAPGDTVRLIPGCDKTFATCSVLQGPVNAGLHIGAMMYVPNPEVGI